MNDKKITSNEELLESLYTQERHPNLNLIQALLERGDEIVPALIDIVETEIGWPQTHAILLLCELRAETALPALQDVLSGPEGQVQADWLLDDAMINFGPAALNILEAVATDKKIDWYPRASSCRMMVPIAYRYPETYERVTAFLRSLLPPPDLDWQSYEDYEAIKKTVDDPQVWTSATARLCDLRDPKAYPLIGQLFQGGLIDEMSVDPASYEKAYQQSAPPAWAIKEPVDLLTRLKATQPKPAKSSVKKKKNWKSRWTRKRKKKRKKK
jgi:hypothetical protein